LPPRLLIVEDDNIQLELLKEIFEQRGFLADTASDGLAAISKLNSGQYDAALIDYRIPKMDGLASARVMHELLDDQTRPKLIAITADAEALRGEGTSSEVFNAIVPKPLNLASVVQTVEHQIAANGACTGAALWRECGLAGAPAALVVPEPTRAQASQLRAHFDMSPSRTPDLVLLADTSGIAELADRRLNSDAYSLPFVDLTGAFGDIADATFLANNRSDWVNVAGALRRFSERRLKLAANVLNTGNSETRLLAYLFLSGRPFQPLHDASSEKCVRYPGFFPARETIELAERLAARGLLERRFTDRFHVCDRCRSFRLNVREECPSCRSAHLWEVPILHHYRCAHQAPEPDFIAGGGLVCPKCRQQLRHYGSEYDKPGHAFICSDCKATHSEAAIGFVCLDCKTHMQGDRVPRQDVFAYYLSEAGAANLTSTAVLTAPHGGFAASARRRDRPHDQRLRKRGRGGAGRDPLR
jgi:CheY-like chemotaxis protein